MYQERKGNPTNQNGQNEILGASPPKRARKTPKDYVPKPRSGAYALLLTLADLPEGQTTGLTKVELQIQAQPLADASFTVPPDPSKHHTSWNSMATLESKHLVYTFGRPTKKYALTEEGWAIAKSMKETAQSGSINVATISQGPSMSARGSQQESAPSRDRITIDVDDDIVIEVVDDFEDRIRRKFGSKENFKTTMADNLFSSSSKLDQEALGLISEFAQRASRGNLAAKESPASRKATAAARKTSAPYPRSNSKADMPMLETDRLRGNSEAANSKPIPIASTPIMIDDIVSYQTIIAPPGSFTVELVLDTREVRAKTDRNYIQDELNKAGLRCEQRALQIGDMIWTAKIHDPNIINKLEPNDRKIPEIVLDYVVERKRLDDLDSSIKDKRFLEQKFRLKRSGIRNTVYIIEDYGSLQAMEDQQHTRMVTAIAATQIIDGFFVKRTRKLDDTITYLANMTRLLKEKYEQKALFIIPTSVLTPQNHFILRASQGNNAEHRYITYAALTGLASKSGTLTLRDVFLKMLMCTRGITGDKAIHLQKHWQTPYSFIQAFQALPTATQRAEMIWKIAGNFQDKRKVGKAVSQSIAETWGIT